MEGPLSMGPTPSSLRRNKSTNTGYEKSCNINEPKNGNFQDAFTNLFKIYFMCFLDIMHGWGALDFRICLAPAKHGCFTSAQSYDLCPSLVQNDTLDFTLSRRSLKI